MNLDARARTRLDDFGDLVRRWNRAYNLIGRRDVGRLEARHINDSLSLVAFVKGGAIADVGSGAGFPGVPLAIAEPAWSVTLVERSQKKARFLRQVLIELDLDNIELVVSDARRYRPIELFDTVTARALAKPVAAWETVRHLIRPGGVALLQSTSSLAGLSFPGGSVARSETVEIAGVERASWVTEVQRLDAGP